ncbi:MAG TPA: hypothetical protein VN914_17280 [Polyangia bacterium]|nr:hypothetical protein [Polyangia bacterium]
MQAQVKEATRVARMELETTGKAVEVAEGMWVLATRHRPGLSKYAFEINNRCLIFRLHDARLGCPVLAVVNAVDPVAAIPEVRRLEHETGLPVRYVVSPGGGHHLQIEPWHDQFTEAQVLIAPVRIPLTAHGKELLRLPRVVLMDANDPLPQFRGQLDAVLFRGLVGVNDHQAAGEGAPDTRFGFMKRMAKLMTLPKKMPAEELWLHHVPTGTVIGGENLAWMYPAAALRGQPFMLRSMLKPDRLWIWTFAITTGDAATVADSWRRILAWPARTVMSYHDATGFAFTTDARAALEAAARAVKQI